MKSLLNQVKVLCFDIGNTLYSLKLHKEAWKELLKTYNLEFEKFIHIYNQNLLPHEGAFSSERKLQLVFQELKWENNLHDIQNQYRENLQNIILQEITDDPQCTWSYIQSSKNRYKLGILSDNDIISKKAYIKIFEEVGYDNLFDFFIVSEEIGYEKPHELMFKTMIDLAHSQPNDILYFGDNLRRDNHAIKYGINFCHVYGHSSSQQQTKYHSIKFINKENLNRLLI